MARTNNETFSNPSIKKLNSFSQSVFGVDSAAGYKGIAAKTIYFVVLFALGMGAYFYMHSYFAANYYTVSGAGIFANEQTIYAGALVITLIAGLIASFVPSSVPITGSIYSAGMGYSVTFLSMIYARAYKGIVFEAISLTLLVILVMAGLYASGKVKVTNKFRTVITTALLVSLMGSLIFWIIGLVAPHSAFYTAIVAINQGPLGIVIALLGVVLAAAFLLSDFDTIQMTVENGLDKKYEWFAAYGLIVGVIYLYLKVLRLLAIIMNNRD